MSEFIDDKRKTAPPSSLIHQQSFGNTKSIGVAPLRTSHIIKSPPLENGNTNGNGNSPATRPRIYSVNVSASTSSPSLDLNQQQQQQQPAASITNSGSHSSGQLLSPPQPQINGVSPRPPQAQQDNANQAAVNGQASSPTLQSSGNSAQTQPTMPLKSTLKSPPPKLVPRQASSLHLSPNTSSISLLSSPNSDDNSDTSSFLGDDASSFIGDDLDPIEDSDDDTDEEVENMHDNLLKECGMGGVFRDELKEQEMKEMKEMELLAGGTKFRVTRCFVGSPVGHLLSTSPGSHSNSMSMRKSIYPAPNANASAAPNTNTHPTPQANANAPPSAGAAQAGQNQTLQSSNPRKTVFNPRFSIYRPVAPRKPLPAPPTRKPVPKVYTEAQTKAAIKIQKCWRRYQQMLPFKKLKILYRYRWNIVQEIYSTEKTYLRTLEQLSQLFIEPLRKNGLISPDDVKLIFGGIDAIIAINTRLMSDIEEILANWKPYSILGKSFTTLGVFLKAYTDYVKNFDFSLRRLEACSKEMKFVAFIKQAEDRIVPRSRLESLLITPVQRIPRYVLLLQDLLKHTEASHPDFSHISEGLEIIKKVALSINDTKRRADNSLKVIEVQNKLVGKFPNLVVADRRYVHEGYLLSGPNNMKTKKCYIFLFNDIIIFSRPSSNKIFSKSKFKFLKIEDLLPSPSLTDVPNNPIMTHAFEIVLRSVTCTFLAETEEQKQIWLTNFNKVFSDINSHKSTNQTLDKRAVEKAGQAKTYIENHFTNIMVKGRATRGGTVRGQAPEAADESAEPGAASNDVQGGPAPGERHPMMVRQATFHNMTILQREERLKGLAEETTQLKMEHQKSEQQQSFNNNLNNISQSLTNMSSFIGSNGAQTSSGTESKYASVKFGTVGRSTIIQKKDNPEELHIDGTATLQPEKKRTGAPSLNKIFSTINLSSSKDKEKEKEKEKERDAKAKSTPPSLSSINSNPSVKQSSLNLSALNFELKNRQNANQNQS